SIASRCGRFHEGPGTDGVVSASLLSVDAAEASGRAERSRRNAARAAGGRLAAAGSILEHAESQFSSHMALCLDHTPSPERQGHRGHLYGIRPAETDETA